MIFDQENIFFDATTDLSESNVIANVGGGDAANPLFLVVVAVGAELAGATFTLETCNDEEFSDSTELGSFTTPDEDATGAVIRAKVPYGAKKFLRLTCDTTSTEAEVTAGLVADVPNWDFSADEEEEETTTE